MCRHACRMCVTCMHAYISCLSCLTHLQVVPDGRNESAGQLALMPLQTFGSAHGPALRTNTKTSSPEHVLSTTRGYSKQISLLISLALAAQTQQNASSMCCLSIRLFPSLIRQLHLHMLSASLSTPCLACPTHLQDVPRVSSAFIGQRFDFPLHTSATSQGPAADLCAAKHVPQNA